MIKTCDIILEWLSENGYSTELIELLASIPHFSFIRVFKYKSFYSGNYASARSVLISINNDDFSVAVDTYGVFGDTRNVGWLTSPDFFKDFRRILDDIGVEPYDFK